MARPAQTRKTKLEAELSILYEKSSKQAEERVFGITNNFQSAFDGIRKDVELMEVRFHDLRHTAATRLVRQNVPLPLVGRVLGHSQANTTMRYVNANIETARLAAEALAAFVQPKEDEKKEEIHIN